MLFGKINSRLFDKPLPELPGGKLLINTINAYSYIMAKENEAFQRAIKASSILLPDGVGITLAARFLDGKMVRKIAGEDLFYWQLNRLDMQKGKCFFLGSSRHVLGKIERRLKAEYPNVQAAFYSPPYKKMFTEDESEEMINAVNAFKPDVLFIGMTAPKQETWAHQHFHRIHAMHVCSIGAVFDFFAGTVSRSPRWMVKLGLEWLYRLVKEPRRLWKRYLIGNTLFVLELLGARVSRMFGSRRKAVHPYQY